MTTTNQEDKTSRTPHAAAQARYAARKLAGLPTRVYRRRAAGHPHNVWRANHSKSCNVLVQEAKAGRPCLDCGGRWPPVAMDFDHVRGDKVLNIAMLVRKGKLVELLAELDKCDLVCAACHRVRTQKRINEEREVARDLHQEGV